MHNQGNIIQSGFLRGIVIPPSQSYYAGHNRRERGNGMTTNNSHADVSQLRQRAAMVGVCSRDALLMRSAADKIDNLHAQIDEQGIKAAKTAET